jgi:oligopeptide transport system substrate-binding protein
MKKSYILLGATLLISPLLIGCGKNKATAPTNKQAQEQLAKDQTIELVESQPSTLDVRDIRNSNEADIITQVQTGLYRTFNDGKKDVVKLDHAKSVTLDESKKVHTIKLRENHWSDGKKVVAQDYVDFFTTILNPDNSAYPFATSDQFEFIKGGKEYYEQGGSVDNLGVKAIDEDTLEITTAAEDFDPTHTLVGVYPIRKDLATKVGDQKKWGTDWQDQVYSGPFKVGDWRSDSDLTLVKNSSYYGAKKVILEKAHYTFAGDANTTKTLFESKQLDALRVSGGKIVTDYINLAKKDSDITKVEQESTYIRSISINQKDGGLSGLLGNAKIRQAIALTIDRDEYIKVKYDGYAVPAYGQVPSNYVLQGENYRDYAGEILKKEAKAYNNSPEKLQKLFKEGLKELGKDTDLSKITLKLNTYQESLQANPNFFEWYKQTFKNKLGINIEEIANPDSASFVAVRNKNAFDLNESGWGGSLDVDGQLQLWAGNYGFKKFFGNYNSDAYDALYNKAVAAQTVKEKFKYYKKAETQLVAKDYGTIPLAVTKDYAFIHGKVKDLQVTVAGPQFELSKAYIVSE